MPPANTIILSAILPAWDSFDSVRVTIRHLALQSIARHMEVVFICPDAHAFQIEPDMLSVFAAWSVVEIGEMDSRSYAYAEGVRAARGEFVVLCEDHCFPEPGWAEALVARHREDEYAVVGPMFENANPENAMSQADFLIAYAKFMAGGPTGNADYVAGHNSCYPRALLLEEGDGMVLALESEFILHQRYAVQGKKIYVEPGAVTHHTNFATFASAMGVSYLSSRVFGGNRAAAWSPAKRMVFAAAAPVIPFVRLWRISRWMTAAGWGAARQLGAMPGVFACLCASAWGEWIGNFLGHRHNTRNLANFEFHRMRFSPELKNRDLVNENWWPPAWKGKDETL